MGFLDFMKGGGLKKHAGRVANKYTQAPDRWESIQALRGMNTPEAVEALLVRYTFRCDPSITDQEEKESVVEGIVEIGKGPHRDAVLKSVRNALRKQDSITWPVKCLERLLTGEELIGDLLGLLGTMDTDYERDPVKKIQSLIALEERNDARIASEIVRFLDDMNEDARYHTVATLFRQTSIDAARAPMVACFLREDGVRVRAAILDGFIEREWVFESDRDAVAAKLPEGYRIDANGFPRRG